MLTSRGNFSFVKCLIAGTFNKSHVRDRAPFYLLYIQLPAWQAFEGRGKGGLSPPSNVCHAGYIAVNEITQTISLKFTSFRFAHTPLHQVRILSWWKLNLFSLRVQMAISCTALDPPELSTFVEFTINIIIPFKMQCIALRRHSFKLQNQNAQQTSHRIIYKITNWYATLPLIGWEVYFYGNVFPVRLA